MHRVQCKKCGNHCARPKPASHAPQPVEQQQHIHSVEEHINQVVRSCPDAE
jgi:hypothetical protein